MAFLWIARSYDRGLRGDILGSERSYIANYAVWVFCHNRNSLFSCRLKYLWTSIKKYYATSSSGLEALNVQKPMGP